MNEKNCDMLSPRVAIIIHGLDGVSDMHSNPRGLPTLDSFIPPRLVCNLQTIYAFTQNQKNFGWMLNSD